MKRDEDIKWTREVPEQHGIKARHYRGNYVLERKYVIKQYSPITRKNELQYVWSRNSLGPAGGQFAGFKASNHKRKF